LCSRQVRGTGSVLLDYDVLRAESDEVSDV
jgi:hypothetical protein